MAAALGMTYIFFFFSWVILAPIFLIASGILLLRDFVFKRGRLSWFSGKSRASD
jgi:hypothetical protein